MAAQAWLIADMGRLLASGLLGVVLLVTSLSAAEVNQRKHPPPDAQVKINNALAKSYAYSGAGYANAASKHTAQGGCGNTQLGAVNNSRAGRIDNTFVARGDVIIVNRNIRCP